MSTLRDLHSWEVRVRSLAPSEQQWTRYFAVNPDSPEAMIGELRQFFHVGGNRNWRAVVPGERGLR